jgi:REP element-mobilizing transposase RayT
MPLVDMTEGAPVHHRRSIRLKGYDYSALGAYFVTLCIQDRLNLLGRMEGPHVALTPAGEMARRAWEAMPEHYPEVGVDTFVVMPNHLHGIVLLRGADHPEDKVTSLGDVIKRFKSVTTRLYITGVSEQAWTPFPGRLWQRNYYEHIIRSDEDLWATREYIHNNPSQWAQDRENPKTW